MTPFWQAFIPVALLAAAAATTIVWSRRETALRGLVMVAFFVVLVGAAFNTLVTLGHHRPVSYEALRMGYRGDLRAILLGHKMIEGKAIYLYLDRPGEPLAIELPWSDRTAEQLQEALRRLKRGQRMQVIIPYEHSFGKGSPQFRPLPQPKFLPDKIRPERPPERYERT